MPHILFVTDFWSVIINYMCILAVLQDYLSVFSCEKA